MLLVCRKMNETQIRELENSVLERCRPHGSVVHVWVDKRSPVVSQSVSISLYTSSFLSIVLEKVYWSILRKYSGKY